MLKVELSQKTKELLDFTLPSPASHQPIDLPESTHQVVKSEIVRKATERFRKQVYSSVGKTEGGALFDLAFKSPGQARKTKFKQKQELDQSDNVQALFN